MQQRQRKTQLSPLLRVVAALLAVWIFVLSLAAVSPTLHAWLHAQPDCAAHCADKKSPHGNAEDPTPASGGEGHYCAIAILQSAQIASGILSLPEAPHHFGSYVSEIETSFQPHRYHSPLQARAPPFEI